MWKRPALLQVHPPRAEDERPSTPWRVDPLRAVARRAAEGNEEALETLLMELGGPMLRAVRKVLGAHHPSVEDLAQEAALQLVGAIGSFRGECSVTHFAVRIALRTALQARRHFAVRQRVGDFSEEAPEAADDGADSPLDALLSRERRRVLREVMDGLAPQMAEAMALHFVLGMTVPEIAELEGVSTNTIWSRLRLGKQSLRHALAHDPRLRNSANGEAR